MILCEIWERFGRGREELFVCSLARCFLKEDGWTDRQTRGIQISFDSVVCLLARLCVCFLARVKAQQSSDEELKELRVGVSFVLPCEGISKCVCDPRAASMVGNNESEYEKDVIGET